MRLSLILTINNRTPEVCKQVANSFMLEGNRPDDVTVVLDRVSKEVEEGATAAWTDFQSPVRFITIDGTPGWRGPARAWNAGFRWATGDLFYCISSDVVQKEWNVDRARTLCSGLRQAVFGMCHNSTPEHLVVGAEPGLLVSSKMPRPIGFIVCMPAAKVKEIGGFDEAFMGTLEAPNFWFDDDDFMLRLWKSGVDFEFDDSIRGTHLAHARPVLETVSGQAGIARNAALMTAKHGTQHPWPNLPKLVTNSPGRTVWRHL